MIEIKGVNKFYGSGNAQVHAVKNASLTLPEHGIVALFGKSGCGKTTLLNIIGGLDTAQQGDVFIDGEKITPNSTAARNRNIGYIFQNYNLSKNLSVYENVALSLRLCGVTDTAQIDSRTLAALRSVEMEQYKNRLPDSLSGGQQQRVAIARALVKNPRLILADEPTGNLDEQNTLMVMDLLRQVSKDHLVLLITHETDLVDYYCDMVIEIADGAIVNTRQNELAQGYTAASARDIYLGELPHSTVEGEGVCIDYYGNAPQNPPKLRLISVHGTLYLEASADLKLRLLDGSSEIKVHSGKREERDRAVKELDPALQAPLQASGHPGRVFTPKTAVQAGYRAHFGKQKKGKKLLVAGLLCFAMVFTFLISYLGHSLSVMDELQSRYDANTVFVDAAAFADMTAFQQFLERAKVDSVGYVSEYISPENTSHFTKWSFGIGNFETTKNQSSLMEFEASAGVFDVYAIGSATVLHGTKELKAGQILLSSAMADQLLQAVGVDYIDDYEDLLYLNGEINSYPFELSQYATSYTVVGIVDYDSPAVFMTSNDFSSYNTYALGKNSAIGTVPALVLALLDLESLTENEVYVSSDSNVPPKITLAKKEYTDKGSLREMFHSSDRFLDKNLEAIYAPFAQRVQDLFGKTQAEVLAGVRANAYKNYATPPAICNWLRELVQYNPSDAQRELIDEMDTAGNRFSEEQYEAFHQLRNELDRYIYDLPEYMFSAQELKNVLTAIFFMTEQDTDPAVYSHLSQTDRNHYYSSNAQQGDQENTTRLALHASPAHMDTLLGACASLSESYVITPSQQYEAHERSVKGELTLSAVLMLVVGGLMALCLYFMMRSTLMNSIKEIGTYRAIGVSSHNIVFQYLVEALVLFFLTIFIGYALASGILWWLLGTVNLLSTILYYPVGLGIVTFLVLLLLSCLCGVLPVALLLRKTPAQILSKYDI